MNEPGNVTDLLASASAGDRDALDRVLPIVYEELRHLAHRQLRRERSDHTLSTTALVHECYLRLVDQTRAQWSDRAHFLALSATAMRRILVDYARGQQRQKRSGKWQRIHLDEASIPVPERADMVVALDDALAQLEKVSARLCRVVECRFFAGMTADETATALKVTSRTVERDWVKARAWLYRELGAV